MPETITIPVNWNSYVNALPENSWQGVFIFGATIVIDQYLQRQSYLQRYSNGLTSRSIESVSVLDSDLISLIRDFFDSASPAELSSFAKGRSAGKVGKFYSELQAILNQQQQQLVDVVMAEVLEIIQQESRFAYSAYGSSRKDFPSVKEIAAVPVLGMGLSALSALALARFSDSVEQRLRVVATEARDSSPGLIISGTSSQRFRDGLIHTRNQNIDRDISAVVAGASANSRAAANSRLGIELEIWHSTLDGRTTKICASRDGDVYPVSKGPRPPAHRKCRSLRIPYLPNSDAMRPYVRAFTSINDLPKADRSALYASGGVGRVKSSLTYKDWFSAQPASFQREWLGPTRYEWYREGKFGIDDFVDPRTGRTYTIADLEGLL